VIAASEVSRCLWHKTSKEPFKQPKQAALYWTHVHVFGLWDQRCLSRRLPASQSLHRSKMWWCSCTDETNSNHPPHLVCSVWDAEDGP